MEHGGRGDLLGFRWPFVAALIAACSCGSTGAAPCHEGVCGDAGRSSPDAMRDGGGSHDASTDSSPGAGSDARGPATDASPPGSGFVATSGCSISTSSSYADGARITVAGPAGSFGTKPNGAKALYVWKFYEGTSLTDSATSRNAYASALNGGAVSGAVVSSHQAPGSAYALQADMNAEAAYSFTGNVVSGQSAMTHVTPWPSMITTGLLIEDADGYLQSNSQIQSFDEASSTITFGGEYSGPATKTGTVAAYVSWAGDCVFPHYDSSTSPSIGQDQTFAFRGMFNFPMRSGDFSRQNLKFIRAIHGEQDLDFYFINDNGASAVNTLICDSQSLGGVASYLDVTGGGWAQTANTYFQHVINYHGNSVAGGTDGFINWVADGVSQFAPPASQKMTFWGAGGDNPGWWEWGDIATRPLLPEAGDSMWGDYMYVDDSAAMVTIGSEVQFPLAWSDTSVTFEMHRKYLDALLGASSLANLHLKVQKSNYDVTDCGYFTH